MFEDSTFESNGKIRTRSRRWALLTLVLNCAALAVIVLLPLVYPEALPPQMLSTLLIVPQPPAQISEAPKPEPLHAKMPDSTNMVSQLMAPRQIPQNINIVERPEPPSIMCADCVVGGPGVVGANGPGMPDPFKHTPPLVVTQHPVRISSPVIAGLIIQKTMPIYPALAKQTRTQGTVVLAAVISKTGTIDYLHVVSGPAMLQQAALDAVQHWRYRPYLLNGDAVEVETTVNVIFSLDAR
jgi:protein TonB